MTNTNIAESKILVIEDDDDIRSVIAEILHQSNCQVLEASDGQQGVQLACDCSPDLIICDIIMPKSDGYEVLGQIRQNAKTALTPFIFLTAKSDSDSQRRGMILGADDYIVKPFRYRDLIESISARLERQRSLIAGYLEQVEQVPSEKDTDRAVPSVTPLDSRSAAFIEELRQRISNINLVSQMLERATSDSKKQEYLKILREECNREIDLLNQMSELQSFLAPAATKTLRRYDFLK